MLETRLNGPQHIDYAKTKSWATLRREDPSFVPPTSANASKLVNGRNEKRQRDEEMEDAERRTKKDKPEEDDDEMEIDDDEETGSQDDNSCTSCCLRRSISICFTLFLRKPHLPPFQLPCCSPQPVYCAPTYHKK